MQANRSQAQLQNDTTKHIIKQNKQQQNKQKESESVPFFSMFRFADKYDYILMVLSTISGFILGAMAPMFVLYWGDFTNALGSSIDNVINESRSVLYKMLAVGVIGWASGWMMITGFLISGQRQAVICRKVYFKSLLMQQIGWFDKLNQSQLSSNFNADTLVYQGAIGQKVALMIQVFGTFIGGFIVAFIQGWLMAIVCLAAMPLIAFAGWLYMKSLQQKSKQFQQIYSSAGGMAQQALYSIKTVKQLNGQEHEFKQYQNKLEQVGQNNIKFGVKISLAYAFMSASIFLLYSLGYWFGSNCAEGVNGCTQQVSKQTYTTGNVITVFFSILISCHNLSQLSPALKKIGQGQASAKRIFQVIDRIPLIKNCNNPIIPKQLKGQIVFENVTFAYPKDPSKIILDNLSIKFDIKNTALVGDSGCGKSTIIQLIMRFYDPDSGTIFLDGIDLKRIDLIWLRQQIGYVGQQPVLFATTIKQNLLYGYKDATEKQIQDALIKAQAYQFVYNSLEKQLDTFVGGGGGQISGGQKQRIAIARALLKKPKILLLDEATSALDRRNQSLIQQTLNKISQGLTTVTVAHRVQSIMSADLIYVINKGKIEQSGGFQNLKRFKDVKEQIGNQQVPAQEQIKQQQIHLNLQNAKKIQEQKLVNIKISMTEKQKKQQQKKAIIQKYQDGIYKRIFGYLQKHRISFVVGIILTLGLGSIYPLFSIYLGTILNSLFSLKNKNTIIRNSARHDSDMASLAFLIISIGTFLLTFIRDFLTYVVGDQITENLRRNCFKKILKMPVSWFDEPKNNCGILSTRLNTDCQVINGMATTYIYILIQCLGTLIAGVVIALYYEWRTALTAIGLMPFVVLAGAIRSAFRNGLSQKADQAYNDSAQIVMESLTNIRTVASFGVENTMSSKYQRFLQAPLAILQKNSTISGLFFGLSQLAIFAVFGILFFIGSIYMKEYGVTLESVFIAIYSIFFTGITIGNNSHFLPDVTQAKLAAGHIFQILDSQDQDQLQLRQQSKLIKEGILGNIDIKQLSFKYNNRQQYVFKKLNISIKIGQKTAFVGASGCGKSTIMQLLQRFYQPIQGSILIDNIDIKDYDIYYLRSCIGVVSQQPVLFNNSFKQNIKYNLYSATDQQIRQAAIQANALTFIQGNQTTTALDDNTTKKGFQRNVGIKGSHISGGQKQRVAIARAILRKPKILLLDQATSALDSVNQKKVQQSLDKIMSGKTTLSIAHRIATISNSDQIHVFQKGQIVERGKYEQLIAKKGYFYNLQKGTVFL